MSTGEQLYLVMVIGVFGGWGLWMAYLVARYESWRGGKPEARRAEDEVHHDMAHAGAD